MADISIGVTSDTRPFMQGVNKGVIDPLEDVEDVLKDVSKAGDKTGDALTDSMRDSQKATEKTEGATRDLVKEIQNLGKKGKSAGDEVKDGMRQAEAGTEDFKKEAQGTAQEVAQSFDGSAESIAGGFQELAAQAFSGFGPAGAVAGVAAAAGIGLVTAELTKQQEAADEFKRRLSDAYRDAAAEGRTFINDAEINSQILSIMFDDENKATFEQAKKDAQTLGVSVGDVLRGVAGDAEKLNELSQRAVDLIALQNDKYDEAKNYFERQDVYNRITDLETVNDTLENQIKIQDDLKKKADLYKNSISGANDKAKELGQALQNVPKSTTLKVDADTSAATRALDKLQTKKLTFTVGMKDAYGRSID